MAQVDERGGAARAIEARFFQEEIARSAYEYQVAVERGDTPVIGVNTFADAAPPLVIPAPDYRELERGQVARLTQTRARRDARATARAVEALGATAAPYAKGGAPASRPALMPRIIDAVRARATVGEISDALRAQWGEYRPA